MIPRTTQSRSVVVLSGIQFSAHPGPPTQLSACPAIKWVTASLEHSHAGTSQYSPGMVNTGLRSHLKVANYSKPIGQFASRISNKTGIRSAFYVYAKASFDGVLPILKKVVYTHRQNVLKPCYCSKSDSNKLDKILAQNK